MSSTRSLASALCGLVLLASAGVSSASSIFTLDWVKIPIEPEKGVDFWMALNPAVNNSASNPNPFDASVVKMHLPPCAVRTMHIHRNTAELHYILSGEFLANVVLPDGTVVSDIVKAGQSFTAPANYVHQLSNPSCTDSAEFMGFYNHYDAANNNIAAAAYGILGGPFKAYADPAMAKSLGNSVGIFAYDPVCLKKCGMGETAGELPCDPASGPSDTPSDTCSDNKGKGQKWSDKHGGKRKFL